tara:strand:+ start:2683 stop:2808 length:126 start_codon:yes stop_codon:yes gene_type:complete
MAWAVFPSGSYEKVSKIAMLFRYAFALPAMSDIDHFYFSYQ